MKYIVFVLFEHVSKEDYQIITLLQLFLLSPACQKLLSLQFYL